MEMLVSSSGVSSVFALSIPTAALLWSGNALIPGGISIELGACCSNEGLFLFGKLSAWSSVTAS